MDGLIYEHRYNARDFVLPRHYESVYQILIVLQGHITYTVDHRDYDVRRGDVVLLNTLEQHSLEVLEYPYERVLIRLTPSYFFEEIKTAELVTMFLRKTKGFNHAFPVSHEAFQCIIECITSLDKEYRENRNLCDVMVNAEIRKVFVYIYRECKMDNNNLLSGNVAVVSRAVNHMSRHFSEPIALDELAMISMVSKDHLSHIFTKMTGISIKQYLIRLRINHAKFLLVETEKNISEIAEECGYSDRNFFSRQFKNASGMSPREFRRVYGGVLPEKKEGDAEDEA